MTFAHHRKVRSLIAGAVLLMLAACGSSTAKTPTSALASSSLSATSLSTTSTAVAATAASTAPASTTAGGAATTAKAGASSTSGCGDAAVAVDKVIGSSTDVTNIKVIGGCMVSVSTSLQGGPAGAGAARDLCDKAADVAYAAGAKSVSINSITKSELAIGIKGAPCIGEP